jgi:hypothetical protein
MGGVQPSDEAGSSLISITVLSGTPARARQALRARLRRGRHRRRADRHPRNSRAARRPGWYADRAAEIPRVER